MLRFAPVLALTLFLAPIAAGLLGTLLPALGYLPAIGGGQLSLQPWRDLVTYPGFVTSLRLSLTIGVGATALSLVLAIALCATLSGVRLPRLLTPVLAAPHAALAIGFAFLVAPSGWLVRLISPWLTGWGLPPPIITVHDPWGIAAILGLTLKEVPYLVLMIGAAMNQVPVRPSVSLARSMGYGQIAAWLKVILPQIYPQIRLPIYAVLAFALSSVEIGLVLAPGSPPPLAVLAARWFADYDLQRYFPAAAAAILQLLLVVLAITLWYLAERGAAFLGRIWIARGSRRGAETPLLRVALALAAIVVAMALASLALLSLWSFGEDWRYPDVLPADWTLATWQRQATSLRPLASNTLLIGAVSACLAVALALGCLENEQSRQRPGTITLWVVYVPLLVPQIAFLFGAQVVLVRGGLDGTLGAVIWAHLLFVFPYAFLSLADPWRSFDPRYARTAAALGASPFAIFWRVKLPMLLKPVLVSLAVGFGVSVGQYLPTLFAGAGRIATLTTEAVTLSSGGDRRVVGVYTASAAFLPWLFYGLAITLPALLFRRRRGLL